MAITTLLNSETSEKQLYDKTRPKSKHISKWLILPCSDCCGTSAMIKKNINVWPSEIKLPMAYNIKREKNECFYLVDYLPQNGCFEDGFFYLLCKQEDRHNLLSLSLF